MEKHGYIYILANYRKGTLYTGVTSNLIKRTWQHKMKFTESFTKTHSINRLVYYETHTTIEPAIYREKQIKAWKRHWKINLIESTNPYWNDLYEDILK